VTEGTGMAQKNLASSLTGLLLASAIFSILPLKVHATDKVINGFSSYRFGMTEDEIRKLSKFDRQEIKANVQGAIINNEKVQLTGDEPIEIAGEKYKLMLSLEEGRLNHILLEDRIEHQNESVESASRSCRNTFMLRYGMVKAKYGSPDSEPETNTVEHIGIVTFAKFTSINGSYIFAESISRQTRPFSCDVRISYSEVQGGNPF
jgi:hypothetical protein